MNGDIIRDAMCDADMHAAGITHRDYYTVDFLEEVTREEVAR